MISAADAQLVGCPLAAAVVAWTESMRSCVAISYNTDASRVPVSERFALPLEGVPIDRL